MSSKDNGSQDQSRQRRTERYAGEFLSEPSMSAPQPIPEKHGKKIAEPTSGADAPDVHQPISVPVQPDPVAQPEMNEYPLDSTQSYPAQPGWTQSYPVQPGYAPQPQWSQSYPVQQGTMGYASQQWTQPTPVPQGTGEYAPAPWTQPYAVQPGTGEYPAAQWTPPYPGQQGTTQQWQQTSAHGWYQSNGYMPPLTTPDSEESQNENKEKPKMAAWKIAAMVGILSMVLIGAVVGLVSLGGRIETSNEVSAYNDRFCEGVYVDGIHLGSMTQAEAIDAVNASAQERLNAWNISLTHNGQLVRQITAGDLGMTVDVNDALSEAWQQGHATSDVDERKAAMDELLRNPYVGYTVKPSGDHSAIDRILSELAAPVYLAPQNATMRFDSDAHAYPFEYTPEVPGRYLNVEPIKRQILDMVDNMQSGAIELMWETIPASVTEAELRRQTTLRGSASTTISTTSTEARTANIERAFEIINGTVVKSGNTFSFNGVVGARSAKNGFQLAIEYAYGNERMGYGGGICQASTTLYLAAVRADMTITKREPHSDKVNYTEYGLDATVNYDGKKIDLAFRNTTPGDVYVMSYLTRSGGRWICRVDIYGEALPDGVSYDLVAETVEVLPAPVDPEYVEDTTGEHVTYIDDTPVQKRKASDGYVVETFKVKYQSGREVERTYVARDTYKAKAQQLWVGIQERRNTVNPR